MYVSPWGYLDVNTDVYGDQRLRIPKSWSYTGCDDMDSELSFHPHFHSPHSQRQFF